jgi:hypothetical protein
MATKRIRTTVSWAQTAMKWVQAKVKWKWGLWRV